MTIYELIKNGEYRLKKAGIQNPYNESLGLMQYALGLNLEKIIVSYEDNISEVKKQTFEKLIERRFKKEPFAYIVKNKEFYSLNFCVDETVLIPRPDTECLVDAAIEEIRRLYGIYKKKINVIDLGTGCGAVAISIAKNFDNVIIYAADNNLTSLKTAEKNIINNGVQKKVVPVFLDILKLNCGENLSLNTSVSVGDFDFYNLNNYDLIISNPPYITTEDLASLEDDIKFYEPVGALDGGKDGLLFYRKIFDAASIAREKIKTLILEIDYRKKKEIQSLFEERFDNINLKFKKIDFINDLNNKERAVKITYG
ncbi:MAG: peptide chain release factor N(5)-glutamine methyltransferase [Deltaproteobacteria bacterium]|jgi:release factor glutamine methyltransferase|uniref:peptide chain release factor N(5)-glutamine methyltransferase n=1 Tax=Candidatus Acidulodesulfobacterium acidiphilum TaxID=2597224 RepID=A0A520XE98_9DELT|nr:peptide chain release factor N(5)-glutamine methyltransferase [Deltaproteobacteria bacterium]MDA8299203.1 peptide chain release factor N(5)-glutamine methyltransferase [Deltaproteobacteria bacterium]RZV39521.1 MAG: peptide chain release factor N(5)-glutamine methyltransferase [Candidatus Acidulodesulfobacterium acidiphilum]